MVPKRPAINWFQFLKKYKYLEFLRICCRSCLERFSPRIFAEGSRYETGQHELVLLSYAGKVGISTDVLIDDKLNLPSDLRVTSRMSFSNSSNTEKLWSLNEMERTGGEPDVVGHDQKTGEYIFYGFVQRKVLKAVEVFVTTESARVKKRT